MDGSADICHKAIPLQTETSKNLDGFHELLLDSLNTSFAPVKGHELRVRSWRNKDDQADVPTPADFTIE